MCRDYANLLPLLDTGEIDSGAETRARSHLLTCAACRQEAERLAQVADFIGRPAPDTPAQDVLPAVRARLQARGARPAASRGTGPSIGAVGRGLAPATGPASLSQAVVGLLGVALLAALVLGLAALLGGRAAPGGPASGAIGPILPVATPGPAPLLDAEGVLSQTINGYTVTIRPVSYDAGNASVHADANQVALDYAVVGPDGRTPPAFTIRWADAGGQNGPRLSDDAGTIFPWLGGASHQGTGPDGTPIYDSLIAFDTNSLHPVPALLPLHLTLTLRVGPATTPGAAGTPAPVKTQVVAGPFQFAFRLPFDPVRREALINQTVTSAGLPLTLERIIATRRETRVILHFPNGTGPRAPLALQASLSTRQATANSPALLALGALLTDEQQALGWLDNDTWAGSSFDSLLDAPGPWTLRITQIGAADDPQAPPLAGRWVFQFPAPPLVAAP